MILIWKTDISLASEIVSSTSCAHCDMQWRRLRIWGILVRPYTGYGLASN